MDVDVVYVDNFFYFGCYWVISKEDYDILLDELEYVVWFVVWGFRVNYFIVSVNYLNYIDILSDVNE